MKIRGNRGKNYRYTVEEKLNALKMLDEGLSQVDIELAKGIPVRTLRRWVKDKKLLQRKNTVINEATIGEGIKDTKDTKDTKDIDTTKDTKEVKEDEVADKADITKDIEDTNIVKVDKAYNEGYIDGGNDKVEQVASQVEEAYKGFVDPAELKQALNEAKNGLARVNVADPAPPSKTPEMPLPEPPEETIIAGLTKWDLGALAGLGGLAGLAYLATKNKDAGKSNDDNW